MLSRVSRTAVCRTAAKPNNAKPLLAGARRGLVQPSAADRASVVDLPSTYQDESHFTPRSGTQYSSAYIHVFLIVSDMLGFKLEMPVREGSMKEKTRPIYLDMQVRGPLAPFCFILIKKLGHDSR
jgi:cysteine desulfurase